MHPAVERYLDRVLAAARLAPFDERAVREELASHLHFLESAAAERGLTDEEIVTMLDNDFGTPDDLGDEIARARGRFRTWLKTRARRTALTAAAAVVLALVIRWQVAEVFTMANGSMDPAAPQGAWLLVNKWASPDTGDLLVFRDASGRASVARADVVNGDRVTVSKLAPSAGDAETHDVGRDEVIGRVWLVSR